MTTKVRAPFTADQVASLNGYQASGVFHEFTCGNDLCPAEQAVLVAAEDGWRCPACTYTQDWAHGPMADGSWRDFQGITVTVDGKPVKGEIGTAEIDEETWDRWRESVPVNETHFGTVKTFQP